MNVHAGNPREPALKSLIFLILAAAAVPLQAGQAEREQLAASLPGVEAADIRETQLEGLYEVTLGTRVVYVSGDGRYMIQGQLVDLEARRNLTEERSSEIRSRWVSELPESDMVIFEAAGETRHTITVFTDVDCSYCRAMHAEIDELQELGIRVRYLLYPRNGMDNPSAQKAESVWCADDRQAALTRAKAGKRVPRRSCGQSPLPTNIQRAREIAVTGTPTIVTQDGDLIRGYLPAERLAEELGQSRTAKSR